MGMYHRVSKSSENAPKAFFFFSVIVKSTSKTMRVRDSSSIEKCGRDWCFSTTQLSVSVIYHRYVVHEIIVREKAFIPGAFLKLSRSGTCSCVCHVYFSGSICFQRC